MCGLLFTDGSNGLSFEDKLATQAMVLVEIDETTGAFTLNPEAVKYLQSINTEVAVVAVAGKYV